MVAMLGRAVGWTSASALRLYLVVAVPIGAGLVVHTVQMHWTGDTWHHAAAIRAFAEDPLHPPNPYYGTNEPSSVMKPSAMVLGVAARLTGASPFSMLQVAALLNIVALGTALFVFLRKIDPRPAFPAVALGLIVAAWGWRPPRFSGFLHLNALGFGISYPATTGLALSLAALALAVSGGAPRLVLASGLAALAAANHPVALALAIGGLVALSAAHALARRVALAGQLLAGAAFATVSAAVWPTYRVFGDSVVSPGFAAATRPMYIDAFGRALPTWIGVGVAVAFVLRRRFEWLPFTVLGLAAVYAAGRLTGHLSLGRALSVLAVASLSLLAGVLLDVWPRLATAVRVPVVVGAAAFGAANFAPGLLRMVPRPLLPAAVAADDRLQGMAAEAQVLERIREDDVVAAPTEPLWEPVGAYGGWLMRPRTDRNFARDVAAFWSPSTPPAERQEVVCAYDIEWALVDGDAPYLPGRRYQRGSFTLIDVPSCER